MIKAYMNWSGGKDSSLALHQIISQKQFSVEYLLTSINKTYGRVSMHGVRIELLQKQAESIGIPLKTVQLPELPTMAEYESIMKEKVTEITSEAIHDTIFGDIFLDDLKKYREENLRPSGITAHFPLWKVPTSELMQNFISLGFKAIIVCVNEKFLDKSFCGRLIDQSFVNDLPDSVDVCGENGEYHSFVFDGPIFKTPIAFTKGEVVYREYKNPGKNADDVCNPSQEPEKNYGFYFCDLLITDNSSAKNE